MACMDVSNTQQMTYQHRIPLLNPYNVQEWFDHLFHSSWGQQLEVKALTNTNLAFSSSYLSRSYVFINFPCIIAMSEAISIQDSSVLFPSLRHLSQIPKDKVLANTTHGYSSLCDGYISSWRRICVHYSKSPCQSHAAAFRVIHRHYTPSFPPHY